MNTLDRQPEIQTDRDRAYLADSYINIDRPKAPSAQPQKPLLTTERLYGWGFRLFAGACLMAFLFVAAIYYNIINP